jgi:predicted Holliday junction resolvase-like endonuclease
MSGSGVAVIVILAVVVVVLIFYALAHRSPAQLTRQLRSTSFSKRRSDRIKEAAARDVAAITEDERYFRRRRARRRDDVDSEL